MIKKPLSAYKFTPRPSRNKIRSLIVKQNTKTHFEFEPHVFLKNILPQNDSLLTKKAALKMSVTRSLMRIEEIPTENILASANKVMEQYAQKEAKLIEEGVTKSEAKEESTNDGKLLRQRIEQAISYEAALAIISQFEGYYFQWLPTLSEDPRHSHERKYFSVFKIEKGQPFPCLEYGCKCGASILMTKDREEAEAMVN